MEMLQKAHVQPFSNTGKLLHDADALWFRYTENDKNVLEILYLRYQTADKIWMLSNNFRFEERKH